MDRVEIRLLCDQLDEDQIAALLKELKATTERFVEERDIGDAAAVDAVHYGPDTLFDQLDEDQIAALLEELRATTERFVEERGIEDVTAVDAVHHGADTLSL